MCVVGMERGREKIEEEEGDGEEEERKGGGRKGRR